MKHQRKNTEIRTLIVAAKVVSNIFRPVYYPLLCCACLLFLSPLSQLSFKYICMLLGIIALFTILVPAMLTLLYQSIRKLDHQQKRQRKYRIIPYLLHIICYLLFIRLMYHASVPYLVLSVIIVALCIQIVCTIINLKWKVSVHATGAGAIVGALGAYAFLFFFNPLFYLCGAFILVGLVDTSRMILRQHNLSQLLVGNLIGILCGFFGILRGDIFFPN